MLPNQVFLDGKLYADRAMNAGRSDLAALLEGRGAEIPLRMYWAREDVPPFIPSSVDTTTPAPAQCQQGTWIVVCPLCGLGAQYAVPSDPRFLCLHCLNETVGGAWLQVVWPPFRTAIEAVLRKRQTVNANWLPGETVADLVAENTAHGIGA